MPAINSVGYLPFSAILAALTNFQDSKGKVKFLEVEPQTPEVDYFEDKGLHLSEEEIIRSLIDVDDDGDFAIRYANISVTGSTKFPTAELSEIQIVRSWVGKAADGRPYLRMVFQELA